MGFSSVVIYKAVERMKEVYPDLMNYSETAGEFSEGKLALFKKVQVGGLVTQWEQAFERVGGKQVTVLKIDNGIEELEFTVDDEVMGKFTQLKGNYVKVVLMGNWIRKKESVEQGELCKAVDIEVIGKYEMVEVEEKKVKKKSKKKKLKTKTEEKDEGNGELGQILDEEEEYPIKNATDVTR